MSIFRRRSFTETVEGRKRFLAWAGLFTLVFLCFQLISGVFLSAYRVDSVSMSPGLLPGDLVVASPLPFGPSTLFGKVPAPARPQRGDLVLLRPPFASRPSFVFSFGDSLLRFVTFQQLSLPKEGLPATIEGPFVLRLIALPGDEVSMEDFVFKVRPAGDAHALTEFEFSSKRYDIHKPSLPEGWKDLHPLSGEMDRRVLGKDEYFVAADDRESSADSRSWGAVSPEDLEAKVLFRYWPLGRFGSL